MHEIFLRLFCLVIECKLMRRDSMCFTTLPQLVIHLLKAHQPVAARRLKSDWRLPSSFGDLAAHA